MKFIHENLDHKLSDLDIDVGTDYSYKNYENIIMKKLFEVLMNEMLKMPEKHDKSKEDIIRRLFHETTELLKTVSLYDNFKNKENLRLFELQELETSELILKLLNEVDLSNESYRGSIKLEAWKQNHDVTISLKNVSQLIPRPTKTFLNFHLELCIQPKGRFFKSFVTEVGIPNIFCINPLYMSILMITDCNW